jgi:hypothetical protein
MYVCVYMYVYVYMYIIWIYIIINSLKSKWGLGMVAYTYNPSYLWGANVWKIQGQ